MIYFAQSIEGGPIKIGCSDNVETRRKTLESHYGCKLVVLATMRGGQRKEAEIHERFAHLRYGKTEQFQPAAELMEFIGKPLLVSPNPEAVEAMLPRTPNEEAKGERYAFRARAEWMDWLQRFADFRRKDKAQIIDEALEELARLRGFESPPKR